MKSRFSLNLRILSMTLALSLTWLDVAWALDPREKLAQDQLALQSLTDGQKFGGSPGTYSELNQSHVDQMNLVQDLAQSNSTPSDTSTASNEETSDDPIQFTLKTQNNDLIEYVGNSIAKITRVDGTVIDQIPADLQGPLHDARITFTDGSTQKIEGNKVTITRPSGSKEIYVGGKLDEILSPSGTSTRVTHDDVHHQIIYTSDASVLVTDAEGNPVNFWDTVKDARFFFADGILDRAVDAAGEQAVYTRRTEGNQTIVEIVRQSLIVEIGEHPHVTVAPDAAGNTFYYGAGELPFRIDLVSGEIIEGLRFSDDGVLTGFETYSIGDKKYRYDANGFLSEISSGPTTIAYSNYGEEGFPQDAQVFLNGKLFETQTLYASGRIRTAKKEGGTGFETYYDEDFAGDRGRVKSLQYTPTIEMKNLEFHPGSSQALVTALYLGGQFYGAIRYSAAGVQEEMLFASGDWQELFPNGKPHFSFEKSSGFKREYYENGKLKILTKPNGDLEYYNETGEIYFDYRASDTRLRAYTGQGQVYITLTYWIPPNIFGFPTKSKLASGRAPGSAFDPAKWTSPAAMGPTANPLIYRRPYHPLTDPDPVKIAEKLGLPQKLVYENNKLTSLRFLNGATATFKDGKLTGVTGSDDESAKLLINESIFGSLLSIGFDQNGVKSFYDAEGRLSQVELDDFTVHFQDDSRNIGTVEKSGKTFLKDVSSLNGKITGATVVTEEGDERTYVDGRLTKIVKADQTEMNFVSSPDSDGAQKTVLDTLRTIDNLHYKFDYRVSGQITADLVESAAPSADTIKQMKYDANLNLKAVIKSNGEAIHYAQNQRIQSIVPAANTEQEKTFKYYADGSYKVTQGSTLSFYDPQNSLRRVLILPHDTVTDTVEVSYAYDKIREVHKIREGRSIPDGDHEGEAIPDDAKTLLFKYSYDFDDKGKEIVRIEDSSDNSLKTYSEGRLLTALDRDRTVLSEYSYNDGSDKVASVTLSRLGRTLHTYAYDYEGENTLVTDEKNVLRTYDKNQKLIFLEKDNEVFGYTYTPASAADSGSGSGGQEIITEKLLTKNLSDGSVVHFGVLKSDGIDRIVKADGTVITDVALNPDGTFKQAKVLSADGSKKVFAEDHLVEEETADGTHFYYENARLVRATDALGRDLSYTYEEDAASGNLQAVWVQSGAALLKYDAADRLLGLKLKDVLNPDAVRQATNHSYQGAGYGPFSIDGDFQTRQGSEFERPLDQSQDDDNIYTFSTHTFPEPQTITRLDYRFLGTGSGHGDYGGTGDGDSGIEYRTAPDGPWMLVPGTRSGTGDTGHQVKNVDLKNVVGIRAWAHGYGSGSDHGNYSASAYIYEIQWTLADQSFLDYSETRDGQNQVTQYRFKNDLGEASYGTDQKLMGGARPAILAAAADAIEDHAAFLSKGPYFSKRNPSAIESSWVTTAQEAVIDPSRVLTQEYSSSGVLETQIKADGTTTLYDDDSRPSQVLNEKGEILIEYFYDKDGFTTRVRLKNAREALPDSMIRARREIESQRAAALLELVKRKDLAYQAIQEDANNRRSAYQYELDKLQRTYDAYANMDSKGKQARSAKGEALAQISNAQNQLLGILTNVDQWEADEYMRIYTAVQSIEGDIEADVVRAFAALAEQETVLKHQILKQEVSPVIYDHYRRILGRDPSSQEYEDWISKIDYETGLVPLSADPAATFAGASLSFDGSGDYLSIPDSGDWSLGSGDFTIDLWVNLSSAGSSRALISQGFGTDDKWQITYLKNQSLSFVVRKDNELTEVTAPWSPTVDAWNHVALVRKDDTFSFYVNGASIGSRTLAGFEIPEINAELHIGHQRNADLTNVYFQGKMDEVRISKTARWSAGFTPASRRSTPDDSTRLLLHAEGSGVVDEGNRAHLAVIQGDVHQDSDHRLVKRFETLAYTVKKNLESSQEIVDRQAYVRAIKTNVAQTLQTYFSKSPSEKLAFAQSLGLDSTQLIQLTTQDAAKILAWLDSRTLHFGQSAFLSLEALLDEKQISYTREDLAEKAILIDVLAGVINPLDDGDLVLSMFALNKVAGLYGLSLTGAQVGWDDLKKFYDSNLLEVKERTVETFTPGNSIALNASGYIEIPNAQDLRFPADFTLEFWIKPTSPVTPGMSVFDGADYYSGGLSVQISPEMIELSINDEQHTTARINTPRFTQGDWSHIALSRQGSALKVFLNGQKVGTVQVSGAINNTRTPFYLGRFHYGFNGAFYDGFRGQYDGVRISNVARYTDSFTPSLERAASDSSTVLLLTAASDGTIADTSSHPHVIHVLGGATASSDFKLQTKTITKEKYLARNNLDVTSQYQARLEDLLKDPSNANPRIIAHINGNHYVVITNVTSDTVTYIDPGIGKDHENESVTVKRSAFEKSWEGNVLLDSARAAEIKNQPGSAVRYLSAQEAMSIRGAFLGSVLGFLGSVVSIIFPPVGLAIQAVAAVVSLIEGDYLSAINSLTSFGLGAFKGLGDFFKGAFQGMTSALGSLGQAFGALGSLFTSAFNGVANFVGDIVSTFGGFLKVIPGVSSQVAGELARMAVLSGVRMGVTYGLNALGVSPEISGLLGSLASATLSGAIKNDLMPANEVITTRSQNIRISVTEAVTLSQVGRLGLDLGLDSSFTNIIGASLGAIQGQQIFIGDDFKFADAFRNILPDLNSSLAGYGLDRLSGMLGVDAGFVPFARILKPYFDHPEYQGPQGENPYLNFLLDEGGYYDEAEGRNVRIPGPNTPERSWFDNILRSIADQLPDMFRAAIDAHFASQPTNTSDPTPPPAVVTKAPLPDGAIAVVYQDVNTGLAKDGYKLGNGTNYTISDRATGQVVKRVSGNLTEEGMFSHKIIKKADGSYTVDLNNPDKLLKGRTTYQTSSESSAIFKVDGGEVSGIRIDGPSQEIIEVGTTKDSAGWITGGSVNFNPLGIRVIIKIGKFLIDINKNGQEDEGDDSLDSTDIRQAAANHVDYLLLNGLREDRVEEGTPSPFFNRALPNSFYGSLDKEKIDANNVKHEPLFEGYVTQEDLKNLIEALVSSGVQESTQSFSAKIGTYISKVAYVMALEAATKTLANPLGPSFISYVTNLAFVVGEGIGKIAYATYKLMRAFDEFAALLNHNPSLMPAGGGTFDVKAAKNMAEELFDMYTMGMTTYVKAKNPDLEGLIRTLGSIEQTNESGYSVLAMSAGVDMLIKAVNSTQTLDTPKTLVFLGGIALPEVNTETGIIRPVTINNPSVKQIVNIYSKNDQIKNMIDAMRDILAAPQSENLLKAFNGFLNAVYPDLNIPETSLTHAVSYLEALIPETYSTSATTYTITLDGSIDHAGYLFNPKSPTPVTDDTLYSDTFMAALMKSAESPDRLKEFLSLFGNVEKIYPYLTISPATWAEESVDPDPGKTVLKTLADRKGRIV